ncbi:MAG: hypothetical protein ACRCWI_05890, partial [Brevinema sp.]
LLELYEPSELSNIEKISPHPTFNTGRGITFSDDLHHLSEEEILERCPSNVIQIRKMKGNSIGIILTFSSPYIPDYISIGHMRIGVKPFKQRPKICYNCLEYGHFKEYCNNKVKCGKCSGDHFFQENSECKKFCLHCQEDHSPFSVSCNRHKFEQEVLDVAQNEHLSLGAAKYLLMGANTNPASTYAETVKKIRMSRKPKNKQSKDISPRITPIPNQEKEKDNKEAEMRMDIVPSKENQEISQQNKDIPKEGKDKKQESVRAKTTIKSHVNQGTNKKQNEERTKINQPHREITKPKINTNPNQSELTKKRSFMATVPEITLSNKFEGLENLNYERQGKEIEKKSKKNDPREILSRDNHIPMRTNK